MCIRPEDEVEDHLLLKGISESYKKWVYCGEQFDFNIGSTSSYERMAYNDDLLDNGVYDFLEDVFPRVDEDQIENGLNCGSNSYLGEEEAKKFSKLLNEAQCEYYQSTQACLSYLLL